VVWRLRRVCWFSEGLAIDIINGKRVASFCVVVVALDFSLEYLCGLLVFVFALFFYVCLVVGALCFPSQLCWKFRV